jgi:hypothetical protein
VLLEQAIKKAGEITKHVIVLSIPDWGITPFAMEKSPEKIRAEIDTFNFICQAEANIFKHSFWILQAHKGWMETKMIFLHRINCIRPEWNILNGRYNWQI